MTHPVVTLSHSLLHDVFAALFLFRRYRIRHLPITDPQDHLMGVITHESVRKVLKPANLLQFRRVADVMTPTVIHASPSTSVIELAKRMATCQVSCIVIAEQHENRVHPVGIVTERDVVQYQFLGLDLANTRAAQVMSTPLFLLSPEDSLWAAHQEMQVRRVGRLVVSWNWGQGIGIVTQTSLLRVFDPLEMYSVIENLQETIAQLQQKKPRAQSIRPNNQSSTLGRDQVGGSISERQAITDKMAQLQIMLHQLSLDKTISPENRLQLSGSLEVLDHIANLLKVSLPSR